MTALISTDKQQWKQINKVRANFNNEVLVGMAVTSHVALETGTATFSEWELTK